MSSQEEKRGIDPMDRVHLCFALGKALEDREAYGEAFAYYDKGNALKRTQTGYQSEQLEAELEKQKQRFDAEFFAQRKGMGCDAAAPIFVLGLPRAGSTLLEQILASHSSVDGTMELANIIGTANRLNGRQRSPSESPYPGVLAQLDQQQLSQLGENYIEDTRQHRQQGLFFVDKMPNNFRHIPLIHLMLPNARIIDARRHPMACCFSGFKQLFAEGQEFTYGLDEIGRYYKAYVDVMSHWDTVLPGRILRVQHEDVVADLDGEVKRILDYCGLPFEQACIDFHETPEGGADAKFGTGPSADLPGRHRAVATLCRISGAAGAGPGLRVDPLSLALPGREVAGSPYRTGSCSISRCSASPCHGLAKANGFSLHAGVSCEGHQKDKRERLCRYIARPAVAGPRLSLSSTGKVLYTLNTPYRDGTTQVAFEPVDFIARLAALVPKPRVNLTRYHGVLAPNHRWRGLVTPAKRGKGAKRLPNKEVASPAERHAAMTWAQRLKRVFSVDIEVCGRCGGSLKVIACIEDQDIIDRILAHLRKKEQEAPARPLLVPPTKAPPANPPIPWFFQWRLC